MRHNYERSLDWLIISPVATMVETKDIKPTSHFVSKYDVYIPNAYVTNMVLVY